VVEVRKQKFAENVVDYQSMRRLLRLRNCSATNELSSWSRNLRCVIREN